MQGLPVEMLAEYVPWLVSTGAALLTGSILFCIFEKQGKRTAAVIVLATAGFATAMLPMLGHNAMSASFSSYQILQKIRPQLKPDTPFYTVNMFDHTLPFYLGKTVTMVAYKDELEIAIGWEAHKFLPDYAAFAKAWQADAAPFAMFAPDDLADFRRQFPLPMLEVARDPRRVIVRKP